jgi:uncharacterized RmlC-like cupin family protein
MPDPHNKESIVPVYTESLQNIEGVTYEKTMTHYFGVGEHCGSTQLNMHIAYLEAGRETRAHFHIRSDIAQYVIEGECTLVTWDQDFNRTERVIRKGDFSFIPRGTIHKDINNSGARFGLIAAYKVYVEPPVKERGIK